MLRRDTEPKQASFADLCRASRKVPQDHILMQMRAQVDWVAIEKELEGYYDRATGRPSYPPGLLLRMLLLEQYADLSDREVVEQVSYNLLYRAFVGLGMDDAVPDDTSLVKFRERVGEEGIRKVFEVINRQWEAAGLIGGERRAIDGVHLWAKVARRSWVGLMRKGRQMILKAVAEVAPGRAEQLHEEFYPSGRVEPRGEEALGVEKERTAKLLEAVRDLDNARVRERTGLVEAMMAETDRPVSFEDPDARWGHKAPDKPFLGYKSHEAIDPDSRMITAVDVVPGNANEAVRTGELLKKETADLKPGAVVIGDGLYNNATTVEQVEQAGCQACFAGGEAKRVSDQFVYDAQADQVACVEGKRSIGKSRVGNGDLYYFSVADCGACPRRDRCLTRGEREGKAQPRRRVYLSEVRKRRLAAGEAGKGWRREQMRVRSRIEAKFDEQMNRHGLRHARYWGLIKVTVQVLLNAIVVNAKRAVKLLAGAGASARPVSASAQA